MTLRFEHDIFISHCSEDKDVVGDLAKRLKRKGIRVWYDEWGIPFGAEISESINNGVEKSYLLILAMSENALKSRWVKNEVDLFLIDDPDNAECRLIPIRLDNCEIPKKFRRFRYFDWRDRTPEQFKRLCREIKSRLRAEPCLPATEEKYQKTPKDIKSLLTDNSQPRKQSLNKMSPCDKKLKREKTFRGNTDRINAVAVSADGRLIASGSKDTFVRLWQNESAGAPAPCVDRLKLHTESVHGVMMTPDGKLIVSGSVDATVRVWKTGSGKCLSVLKGHTKFVNGVAISKNGSLVASGSEDGTVRLWDRTQKFVRVLKGHTNWVMGMAMSADGRTVASSSKDRTIRLWETSSGKCRRILRGHTDWVWGIAITPDGRYLASGSKDRTVRVWDTKSGECVAILKGHTDWVWDVAITADAAMVASGSNDKTLRLWEISSGKCLAYSDEHKDKVTGVDITPDGKWLVSGSRDETVRVYNLSSLG
jgi:WD40 repeat protein